jgi:hypothetical protein
MQQVGRASEHIEGDRTTLYTALTYNYIPSVPGIDT